MPVCSFTNCLSGSKKIKWNTVEPPITLHRFPKDPFFRKLWAQQALSGSEKKISFDSAVICSLHFPAYQYDDSCTGKRKLREDAIPLTPHSKDNSTNVEVICTPSGRFYVESCNDLIQSTSGFLNSPVLKDSSVSSPSVSSRPVKCRTRLFDCGMPADHEDLGVHSFDKTSKTEKSIDETSKTEVEK